MSHVGQCRNHATVSEQKLEKLLENNQHLRYQLDMPRLPVSEASVLLINYVKTTKDYLVPSVWGQADRSPYVPQRSICCICEMMYDFELFAKMLSGGNPNT